MSKGIYISSKEMDILEFLPFEYYWFYFLIRKRMDFTTFIAGEFPKINLRFFLERYSEIEMRGHSKQKRNKLSRQKIHRMIERCEKEGLFIHKGNYVFDLCLARWDYQARNSLGQKCDENDTSLEQNKIIKNPVINNKNYLKNDITRTKGGQLTTSLGTHLSQDKDDLLNIVSPDGDTRPFSNEKRREEISEENNLKKSSKKIDNCPHAKIIEIYHEILPELSRVRVRSENRRKALKNRWKERPRIQWWIAFFKIVKASPFLMGKVKDFKADFDWLIRPTNFIKVREKKYRDRQNQNRRRQADWRDSERKLTPATTSDYLFTKYASKVFKADPS